MKRGGIRSRRLLHLCGVALRHGLSLALGRRLTSLGWLARRLPPADLPRPERLRVLLEELGGTFLKFGQMLALQPDIVSLEVCNALFKLLDRIEPFPYDEVVRTFREDFGATPEELFDEIDVRPLATASVGQVHVARLDGTKVAVKVRRPTVESDFAGDISLMQGLMRVIRSLRLRGLYWLLEPLSEFVRWTDDELDFRNEARYMLRMGRNAVGNPRQRVPGVVDRLCSARILVVEFLDGVTLLDYLRALEDGDELLPRQLRAAGFEPARFAANIIDNFLGDAYRHGIYHADLHPANLMILPDNVVGYVDFGITGVISPHGRRHLVVMTRALAAGDMETLTEHFLQVSAVGAGADVDRFRDQLETMAGSWFDGEPGNRSLKTNITRVMGDMLHLSRRTDILPERDIIKYIRSSIAIDGLITRFEPDFHIGTYLEAICRRYLERQLREERFTFERVLEWSSAAEQLARDGTERIAHALDRVTEVGRERDSAASRGRRRALRGARALQLAAAVFVVAVLSTVAPEPRLGANLWTAELLFVAAGGFQLLRSLRTLG